MLQLHNQRNKIQLLQVLGEYENIKIFDKNNFKTQKEGCQTKRVLAKRHTA